MNLGDSWRGDIGLIGWVSFEAVKSVFEQTLRKLRPTVFSKLR